MRADQYIRLQELQDELTDAFVSEADPEDWPGEGAKPSEWDQQTRGDRYWCKRNANATMTLILRVGSLLNTERSKARALPHDDPTIDVSVDAALDVDKEIAAFEKEAAKIAARILARAAS